MGSAISTGESGKCHQEDLEGMKWGHKQGCQSDIDAQQVRNMDRIIQKKRADRARVSACFQPQEGLLPELFPRDPPTPVCIGNWLSLSDIHTVYI